MWRLIREDWVTHDRDWTRPGFQAVALHRFGVWRMTVSLRPVRTLLSLLYWSLYIMIRNGYGIDLPYSVTLGRRVVIEHSGAIVIHGNAVIGDDCIIRQGVTLGNRHLHRPFDAPRLGARVNVGAGAKVLGAVRVGAGAQIGANAVVLEDVPPGATAVGVPARVIPRSAGRDGAPL